MEYPNYIYILVRGFNLSEKYESQIGSSSQLLGKIKKNPNHQPYVYIYISTDVGLTAWADAMLFCKPQIRG